ncbi:MAG: hypothetical protein AAF591_17485 [Verrucomicrobiota bacterium]
MTLVGVYLVLGGLLLVGLGGIVIGGRGASMFMGRLFIPVGFVYACVTAVLYGFYGVTTMMPREGEVVTLFDWSLSPLLPAVGVYVGLALLVVLAGILVHDLRYPGVSKVRSRVSAVLGYGSAIVAIFCAVRIPFAVQETLSAVVVK